MIDAASRELRERVGALLQRERLAPRGRDLASRYAAPFGRSRFRYSRAQPDITEQVNGPSAQVAYKDGQPTPAAHAFAKKVGVDVAKLEKVNTPKGEYLAATVTRKGRTASEILAETLPKEISTLYWPKNMYWRKRGEVFVRPVRWLVAMLDEQVVPLKLFGISAGKTSRGHRIIGNEAVAISEAQRLCRCIARRKGARRGRARAGHPQGARRGHADDSGSTLARRQAAGRDRGQSDGIPLRHPGQLRSRISRAAGRSAGHGDARPPEIFRHRRCERQAAAAFSGRAQHGRRLRGIDPPRQRTRSARPFQRCALFLADGPEADAARARRSAAQRHVPERSRQLLRQDDARAAPGQLARRDGESRTAWRFGPA